MQARATCVTGHCHQGSSVAKAILKQFPRKRAIFLILAQCLLFVSPKSEKEKKKKRTEQNYINYIIKRNDSCINLVQPEEKDLIELLGHCMKCNTPLSEPGEQKEYSASLYVLMGYDALSIIFFSNIQTLAGTTRQHM